MAYYRCSLRTPDGRMVELLFQAENEREVRRRLEGQPDELLSVQKMDDFPPAQGRLSDGQSHQLLSELAAAQAARVPIDEVLKAVASTVTDARLAAALRRAADACRQGIPLGEALANLQMPARYRAYLAAVSETPRPAEVLFELLDGTAWRRRLRRNLLTALAYPLLSLLAVSLLTLIMVAALAVWLSYVEINIFISYSAVVLVVQAVALLGLAAALLMLRGTLNRRTWEWVALSSPVFGEIYEGVLFVPWLRIMGVLVRTGLATDQVIRIAAKLSGSAIIESDAVAVVGRLGQGMRLSDSLALCSALPRTALAFIRWGEEHQCLDEGFLQAAVCLTGKVELAAKRVPVIVTPIALVLVAMAVLHTFLMLRPALKAVFW